MIALKNRFEAGKRLVPLLKEYKERKDTLVLGLARGGVLTASALAEGLNLPLDVLCPRKIGAPFNPELAIGAISDQGVLVLNQCLVDQLDIPEDFIQSMVEREKQVANQRLQKYRRNRPKPDFYNKIVIVVDDGLATGATMRAAIKGLREEGVNRLVVAVPVSPPDTLDEINSEADQVFCLDAPDFFSAVGQFYEDFSQTEDDEVIACLQKSWS